MKVLHVINSLTIGGAESLLVSMLPLICKEREVEVLLLNGNESPLLDKLKKYNINIIRWSHHRLYNSLVIFRLISILKNYDIVHVHLFPSMYYVAIAKFLSRSTVKLVFTEHSTSNRRLKSCFFRLIDRLIYLNYSKIVCITPEVKSTLADLGVSRQKLCVIYNGIEIEKFLKAVAYDRAQFGYNEDDIVLVMVAAFRREKDHSTVIKSLLRLDHRYKLLLAGGGYQKDQVVEEVRSLGLEDRVKLIGIRNDIERVLKSCDIGILSSHWEGFGLAAVEAMAAGLPVVASNVPGLSDVVKGGGILFEKGDVIDLASKIVSLEDKDYYTNIQKRCIEKAKKYDLHNTVSHLLDLYKKLSKN